MDGSTVGDGDAKTLWIGDLVRARSRQDDVAETRVAMRYFFSRQRRRRRVARRDAVDETRDATPPPIPPRADADALPAPRASTPPRPTQAYWMTEAYLFQCFAHLGARDRHVQQPTRSPLAPVRRTVGLVI